MPCFTAAGRDGDLKPVNKQKNRGRGEGCGQDDERLHHFEHHTRNMTLCEDDDSAVWILKDVSSSFLNAI